MLVAVFGRWGCAVDTEMYAIRVSNPNGFTHWPVVDEARARAIETWRGPAREGQGWVFLFVRDVDLASRTILTEIVKAELWDVRDARARR